DALATWGAAMDMGQIALGHTNDDVAETFLLRLARGSGLNGLSAMQNHWDQGTIRFLRPALHLYRADFQQALKQAGIDWIDDPSNDNPMYDRVRIRQALPGGAAMGLTVDRISHAAHNLRRAQEAIDYAVHALWHNAVQVTDGDVVIDRAQFYTAPDEVRLRLLATLVKWVGNAPYPPRFAKLTHAWAASGKRTLHGVIWQDEGPYLRLSREYAAVLDTLHGPIKKTMLWDGRWAYADVPPGHHIRSLGPKGIKHCPNWRDGGLPRHSILASPSLWKDGVLVAAPLANLGRRDSLRLIPPKGLNFAR
ncbi:MAG: ATP-binding protein, partial [Pseudomonadota bacterium]